MEATLSCGWEGMAPPREDGFSCGTGRLEGCGRAPPRAIRFGGRLFVRSPKCGCPPIGIAVVGLGRLEGIISTEEGGKAVEGATAAGVVEAGGQSIVLVVFFFDLCFLFKITFQFASKS